MGAQQTAHGRTVVTIVAPLIAGTISGASIGGERSCDWVLMKVTMMAIDDV